jgi:hypothetical protein
MRAHHWTFSLVGSWYRIGRSEANLKKVVFNSVSREQCSPSSKRLSTIVQRMESNLPVAAHSTDSFYSEPSPTGSHHSRLFDECLTTEGCDPQGIQAAIRSNEAIRSTSSTPVHADSPSCETDSHSSPSLPRPLDWKTKARPIIMSCSLAFVPMIAFTATILWLVFGHLVQSVACPYEELCPKDGALNSTADTSNYYVDFPAARLVFIASWSSTMSFSLIGCLMALQAYVAAWKILYVQDRLEPTISPYQMSVLLRILNAELLALYELVCAKFKDVFWDRSKRCSQRGPPALRSSIVIFFASITARYV